MSNLFIGHSVVRLAAVTFVIVAAVWVVPLLLPEELGLAFGFPYRIFYTLIVIFCGLLFYLLQMPAMGPFSSSRRAVASVVVVFLTAIGVVTLLANAAPQFAFEGTSQAGATAEEKGKAVFFDPNSGCFLCHSVQGSGGTRGPDLTHVGTVAGNRKPGMAAEDYLKESILTPSAYVVSPYDNIMPPYEGRLSSEVLADLIAYLKSLK